MTSETEITWMPPIDPLSWRPMNTFPRTGERCEVLFQEEVIGRDIFWGRNLMGTDWCLRGLQNIVSPYLTPLGWRPQKDLNEAPIDKNETPEIRKVTF